MDIAASYLDTQRETPGAEPTAEDGRPLLGFRVGIVATLDLPAEQAQQAAGDIGALLDRIGDMVRELGALPEAERLYRHSARPLLRLIAPVAEPVGRIAAREALARSWRLATVLPLLCEEFQQAHPADYAEIDELLAAARVHGEAAEIDGSGLGTDDRGTHAFILRHSDLLILVAPGAPPELPDYRPIPMVRTACRIGLPVLLLRTSAAATVFLLRDGEQPQPFQPEEFPGLLKRLILPIWPRDREERNHQKAVEDHFRRERVRNTGHDPDFLYDGPFAVRGTPLASIFPWFQQAVGGKPKKEDELAPPPLPPLAGRHPTQRAFYLYFQRADAMATNNANTYRGAYLVAFGLGSLSLIAAAVEQFLGEYPAIDRFSWIATSVELVSLCCLVALLWLEQRYRWRERWIDYRLLAELLRQDDLLALVGGPHRVGCFDTYSEMHPQRGWVPWLVGAITRSVGVVGVPYNRRFLEACREYARDVRLPDQVNYHKKTEMRNRRISRRLKFASIALLGGAALAALGKLVLCVDDGIPGSLLPCGPWLGLFAVVLPVLGVACFGIRQQSEFEIVARRSCRLKQHLTAEAGRLKQTGPGDQLTSEELERAIGRAVRMMSAESAGWAEIFEVKAMEP